jgi:glycosyltransferase involved in cell wall biosynthesis
MSAEAPVLIHTEASLGWGGQEIRTLTECKWFRDQGFRCILMASEESEISKAFKAEGLEVIPVAFKKSSQLGDFLRCYKLFKQMKPELVGAHSNIDTRVALAAAAAAGVKRRVRYRHVSIPVKVSPWNHLIYRKSATSVITTANSITQELVENFSLPEGFARTIPTGVADADASDRSVAREMVLEELGLPDSSVLITQVSVLRQWKGHRDLMAAFDSLAGTNPNLHLVLVGGGPGMDYLPQHAAGFVSRDRIHFAGHQKDPYPFFKAADVVTLASTGGEGVPQSVLQCFACGKPFVGTRVGGIPDITEDGVNGLLVSPESPAELAAAISRIIGDPALSASLGASARKTFEETGSIACMGARLRDFLEI